MKSNVWIIGEQQNGNVLTVSYELLNRGRILADKLKVDLCAIIMGENIDDDGLNELIKYGADKVIAVQSSKLKFFSLEPYSACLIKLVKDLNPDIIIAAATTMGRTLMPYVAIKINTGLTADCTDLDIENETGNLLQTRPAIGGNILATIKTLKHRPQMATVRPHSTRPAPRQEDRKGTIDKIIPDEKLLSSRTFRLNFIPYESESTIQDADVVVGIGRGIKKSENIGQITPLAKKFKAALGATRDVVDRGWLSYSHQIGLSGKTVNPKLFFSLGTSGAIQHLAGMQTSKTIIAINNDPDAPIFKVADFGIVGNIFDVVPVLCEKLNRKKNNE